MSLILYVLSHECSVYLFSFPGFCSPYDPQVYFQILKAESFSFKSRERENIFHSSSSNRMSCIFNRWTSHEHISLVWKMSCINLFRPLPVPYPCDKGVGVGRLLLQAYIIQGSSLQISVRPIDETL